MKNIIAIILITFIPLLCVAQGGRVGANNDNILEKRATYIALRLDLSLEQSILLKEKYIEYEVNRKAIRSNYHDQKRKPTTDAEADQQIQAHFQMEEGLVIAKRQFYEQLKINIPSLKLILLPKAEAEFKEMLVQRLQQNKRGRG